MKWFFFDQKSLSKSMLLPEDDVTEGRKLRTSTFNSPIDPKVYFVFALPFSKCLNQVLALRSLEDKKNIFFSFLCSGRARQKEKLKNQAQQ